MSFEIQNWKNQILEYLSSQINSGQINYKDFEKIINEYKNLTFEIQKILEYAYKNTTGKNKKELYKLYQSFSLENSGEMVEKLRNLGYSLKNNEKYKNVVSAISDQAFRIIEKTRYSQRSEVQYMITRIFIVNNKEIPQILSKVFNPIYPDELFKTFIYSFLSGILEEN